MGLWLGHIQFCKLFLIAFGVLGVSRSNFRSFLSIMPRITYNPSISKLGSKAAIALMMGVSTDFLIMDSAEKYKR